MSRIKFSLVKFEKQLLFQIHEQHVSITRLSEYDDNISVFRNIGMNYDIRSSGRPEMTSDTLYLRGKSKIDDSKIAVKSFLNNRDRDHYYNRIMDSFKKWSAGNNI